MNTEKATIRQMSLGPLQTNCYLLGCNETKEAVIIDPAWNGRLLAQKAQEEGWTISRILLTHSHFDHVGGLAELQEVTKAPVAIHPAGVSLLANAAIAANLWQITISDPPPADQMLADGDQIKVGNLLLEVMETPGHAPGHVSFYLASEGVVFDGDVLFQGGIGRTDLPGGDLEVLMDSIYERLLVLPDDTAVLSGHGPATTIGAEKKGNAFLT
jgi:glyoxylase-like metal-dependent hydrolase (beta-lactamase superfamily II)